MGKFRSLETELERLKERIEAENEAKAEIQKAMSRALGEAQIWKSKYTTEACARIEDLENARAKLLVKKRKSASISNFLAFQLFFRQESERLRNALMASTAELPPRKNCEIVTISIWKSCKTKASVSTLKFKSRKRNCKLSTR